MKKNTATKWIVFAFNRTDNTPKTGDAAQITANVYIDGGAANAVDDTNPAELGAGYYIFDITAAECNGDLIVISPASSTANIQVIGVPGAAWTDTLAADVAAVKAETALIVEDTAVIGALGAGLTALATQASVDDIPTVAEFEARTLVAADYTVVGDLPAAAPSAAAVADAVWDEAAADHAAAGSQGKALADVLVDTGATLDAKLDAVNTDSDSLIATLDLVHTDVDAILLDTGTTLDGKLNVLDGKADTISTAVVTTIPAAVAVVDGIVDTILLDTAELQTDWVNGGRLDLLLDSAVAANPSAADIADAVWDEAIAGHAGAGSTGEALAAAQSAGDPWSTPLPGAYAAGTAGKKLSDMAAEVTAVLVDTGTTLDGKINTIDTVVDAILVDTGTTLDAALAVVDANVDAILVDTGTTVPAQIAALSIPAAAPTAAAVADAVWDEVVASGHAVGNSAAVKLMAAAAGLATAQAGLGAVACVVTVTISDVALQDCDVWVTSDEAGTTVVAGTLQTDASGQVTFYLDAGTYYVWQQKTGYNFTNPDELIVT